jgi:hypothetical protein
MFRDFLQGKAMTTREQVLEFFRSEEYIEALKEEDKQEVALACVSYSERIYVGLEKLFEGDKGE